LTDKEKEASKYTASYGSNAGASEEDGIIRQTRQKQRLLVRTTALDRRRRRVRLKTINRY